MTMGISSSSLPSSSSSDAKRRSFTTRKPKADSTGVEGRKKKMNANSLNLPLHSVPQEQETGAHADFAGIVKVSEEGFRLILSSPLLSSSPPLLLLSSLLPNKLPVRSTIMAVEEDRLSVSTRLSRW